jgi:catechol 2,3-dioxygenase-like lactoylglutathione lyase family enzyme
MNIIPILKCQDISESVSFYTTILDFEVLYPDDAEFPYRLLIREGARLDISAEDGVYGSCIYIEVEDVYKLFRKFVERGLDVSTKTGVHGQPTDQTWGMREFYVEDPDGNTLRFGHEIR